MLRPNFVTERHLTFLDELRDSGDINMYGAGVYLESEFIDLDRKTASSILGYWMESFGNADR